MHEPFPLRIGDFKFTNQTKLCSVNQIVNEKWLGIGIVVNGISLIWSGLVSVIIIYAAENAVDIILNALALFFIQEIDNDIMSPQETTTLLAYVDWVILMRRAKFKFKDTERLFNRGQKDTLDQFVRVEECKFFKIPLRCIEYLLSFIKVLVLMSSFHHFVCK